MAETEGKKSVKFTNFDTTSANVFKVKKLGQILVANTQYILKPKELG